MLALAFHIINLTQQTQLIARKIILATTRRYTSEKFLSLQIIIIGNL